VSDTEDWRTRLEHLREQEAGTAGHPGEPAQPEPVPAEPVPGEPMAGEPMAGDPEAARPEAAGPLPAAAVAGAGPRRRRRAWAVAAVAAGVVAVGGAVIVAVAGDGGSPDEAATASSTTADGSGSGGSVPVTTAPATTPAPTTVPATTVPATTVPATTVPATTAPPAAEPERLSGPPQERLPGGQEWPNGLYTDAIMYMRGAIPSEEVGLDVQRRVETILGAANVRNEFEVDPSVPLVDSVIVRLGPSVLFLPDSNAINPQYYEGFAQWAAFLSVSPDVTLTIIGHTDSVGGEEYNRELARRRAEAARAQILQYGIDPARVSVVAAGPDDPVASNDTREGRALNRRIEFAVNGLFEPTA
jgi:outer membrane protein OmpA-like peptidoglycan-associated protein